MPSALPAAAPWPPCHAQAQPAGNTTLRCFQAHGQCLQRASLRSNAYTRWPKQHQYAYWSTSRPPSPKQQQARWASSNTQSHLMCSELHLTGTWVPTAEQDGQLLSGKPVKQQRPAGQQAAKAELAAHMLSPPLLAQHFLARCLTQPRHAQHARAVVFGTTTSAVAVFAACEAARHWSRQLHMCC